MHFVGSFGDIVKQFEYDDYTNDNGDEDTDTDADAGEEDDDVDELPIKLSSCAEIG